MNKRKRHIRRRGLRVTHVHTINPYKRAIYIQKTDILVKRKHKTHPVHFLGLLRGKKYVSLAGFVSEERRDAAAQMIEEALEKSTPEIRMPSSGKVCEHCGKTDGDCDVILAPAKNDQSLFTW